MKFLAAAITMVALGVVAQPAPSAAQTMVSAESLVGMPLVNPNGETLGQVQTVLVDEGNMVRHVIIVVGDGLGTSRRVALDPGRIAPVGDRLVLNATREDLRLLPSYDHAAEAGVIYIDRAYQAPEPGLVAAHPLYSMEEARARIEANGYRGVTNLTLDQEKTWWAHATVAGGQTVRVALDSNGAVAQR